MSKRSASEAFAKKPLSAFAAARARKAAEQPVDSAVLNEIGAVVEENAVNDVADDLESGQDGLNSSDVEVNGSEPGAASNCAAAGLPIKLSSFQASRVKLDDGQVDASLDTGDFLTCSGVYSLKVTQGAVSVYGAYLTPASPPYDIYAPYTHALPTIYARFDGTKIELRKAIGSFPNLRSISPLWNRVWSEDDLQRFRVLADSNDDPTQAVAGLSINEDIQSEFNRLSNNKNGGRVPATVLVTGAKSSGKSTFCRCLLNSFLSSPARATDSTCFWLDLDPGQPEFSCGGQVSLVQIRQPLFGPSFTHPMTHPTLPCRLVRAHTLAANSPREDVGHYLKCAKDLMKHYLQVRGNAPLVINCPGWVAGSGADLIQELIRGIRPSDIIVLETPETPFSELLQLVREVSNKSIVATIPARQRWLAPRPAAELRALQAMSYHHACRSATNTTTWPTRPLSRGALRVESYGESGKTRGLLSYYEPLPVAKLASIIEYSLVALVAVQDPRAFGPLNVNKHDEMSDDSRSEAGAYSIQHSPEGIPYLVPMGPSTSTMPPLDPAFSQCLGQAILTHIDTDKQELHLITPITPTEVGKALEKSPDSYLVLVRGKLGSPDWAILEDVYARDVQASISSDVKPEDFDLSESGSEDESHRADGGSKRRLPGADGRPPYVALRNTTAASDSTTRAANALGDSVWRPRYLPRRTGA
ncbi:hypothetical protein K461DRAFT_314804 [Myriangium duriaei CBS 260.36]|uniref:Polynucleotide 5'-hydroxyl-kinase GRC3 n=1 Tax=Myriangium duriaei CBS 260.36 TaxID=1168546 RepID=A0A9P4MF72_9PEZI|nr:hypothetical protein K461DRAFT_314804 [Myriangium duriaei CBS 260.36]